MNINVKNIKNRIKQIKNNKITFMNDFPYKENMGRNKFRKYDVSVIFIDISNFTSSCKESKNDELFYKNLRCFHEGILDIFKMCKIRNVDIQGDGIFGLSKYLEGKNSNSNIFDCAIHVKSFLDLYLEEYFDYKISITLEKESILVVGRKNQKELVYFGGGVNKAKELNEKSVKNNIVIDESFYEKNKKWLKQYTLNKGKDYYSYCGEIKNDWSKNDKK